MEQTENSGADHNKEPVDRSRRSRYIFWVTAFCLLTAFFLTLLTGVILAPTNTAVIATAPIIDLYVRGVLGISSATILAYVSGSVIDYNGGLGKLFSTGPKG